MAEDPLVLAMANPIPEIMPEEAYAARPDAIIATGRSDYPNQVNNVLCFPFIFRGALDCGATKINSEMKKACVKAIADLARREVSETVSKAYAGEELKFGRDYLIPKPFDPRLIKDVPLAVVKAAMASGVASRPIEDLDAYRNKLKSYFSRSRLIMQPTIEIARRNGVSVEAAKDVVRTSNTVLATLMVAMGEADGMICGKVGRFGEHLHNIRPLISPSRPDGQLSSVCVLLLEEGPLFISDAFVNVNPDEDEIVRIAKDTLTFVQHSFDIEPVVALLSHSNFGTYEDFQALKMKNAAKRLREELPDVQIDGEMNSYTVLNPELRERIYEGANIKGRANVLIMPDMDTASITLGMMRSLVNARLIGPFLLGLESSAHVLIPSVSGRGIFNLTALAVADIAGKKSVRDKEIELKDYLHSMTWEKEFNI